MMPNSVASGSETSLATMEMAEENGCPTLSDRTISSIASGSCSSSKGCALAGLHVDPEDHAAHTHPTDIAARTGTAVDVPTESPMKATDASPNISITSCCGEKAIAAFCALFARIE